MKVIHQLITYFNERGLLSIEDLEYLHREGYYHCAEGASYDDDLVWNESDLLLEGTLGDGTGLDPESLEDSYNRWTDFQEEVDRHWSRTRKGASCRGRKTRYRSGNRLLCEKVGDSLREAKEDLAGLIHLAGYLGRAAHCEDAALLIRNADPVALYQTLLYSLESRKPSLESLWRALSFEWYHRVLENSALQGSSTRAFRAVLSSRAVGSLGLYGAQLKRKEIRQAYNLVQAQRRLLAAFGHVYHHQSSLLTRCIRRDYHPAAFAAFTILSDAKRFELSPVDSPAPFCPNTRPMLGRSAGRTFSAESGEANQEESIQYVPYVKLPSRQEWVQAWSQALLMDPNRVLRLLHYYSTQQIDEAALKELVDMANS